MNKLENSMRDIIAALGEDLDRPGLKKTPKRAALALQELLSGYQISLDEVVNGALFPTTNNSMVIVNNIEFYSMCEHHLLPFYGRAHIGYIPNGKVLGLSKIPRIVDMYARRLQIQENLSEQIAEAISEITNAEGVGVILEGYHLCMMMRGTEKQNACMTTSSLLGVFMDDGNTRAEFLSLLRRL
ncbi:MAG: GTP cyclohydrolase I FolE [Pseudomonadota bacterium]